MTDQAEATLRQSLDYVDRMRRRMIISFALTAALAQVAWFAAAMAARNPDVGVKQMVVFATMALAMCVFGGVFSLALLIIRLTHRVLQAIEISSK